MKSIGEVLKLSGDFLQERKVDRPKRVAEELLSYVLSMKKMDLYLQFDKPIVDEELNVIRELLKKCAKGEPLEYVMGEVDFFGCKIKIDRRVLIPRPETEILVDLVSKQIEKGVLWDICTGSGCIGISLKKAKPDLTVVLSDISPDALTIARENSKLNRVDVEILHGDLLNPFEGRKADYILCNPPYISNAEFDLLDSSVKNFEPKLALVGGESGIEFYEQLERQLSKFMNPGGRVFFEIGKDQGDALKAIFKGGEVLFDWAGHARFFIYSY